MGHLRIRNCSFSLSLSLPLPLLQYLSLSLSLSLSFSLSPLCFSLSLILFLFLSLFLFLFIFLFLFLSLLSLREGPLYHKEEVHMERNWGPVPKAMWVVLEVDPPVPVKTSYDCSPIQSLGCVHERPWVITIQLRLCWVPDLRHCVMINFRVI